MVRLKNRYLVVLVMDTNHGKPANINEQYLYQTITASVKHLHGVFGVAVVNNGLSVKYINKHTGLVVIRARRGPHRLVASALPLIHESRTREESKFKFTITTLYTGACVKQCLLFIKRYQMDEYHKAAASMNEEERQKLRETYMNYTFQA